MTRRKLNFQNKRIGIMGGTFDPIHIGHLILGEAAFRQFSLAKVLYMPAGNPPHKKHREGRASDDDRVEMVRLAIEDNPHFALSLDEMTEDGYSYTYRTLEKRKKTHPDEEIFFIIGADSLADFDTWRYPDRIVSACHIVAATRNQTPPEEFHALLEKRKEQFHGDFLELDTPNLDISSRNLREMITAGESVRYYLPEKVRSYIFQHGLYAEGDLATD